MKINYIFFKRIMLLSLVALSFTCCKKFVEADLATNLISRENAFATDASATSATLSLYSYYPTVNSLQYVSWLGGLSADELQNTTSNSELIQFSQNTIPSNTSVSSSYLWDYPYQVIRECNLIIDGVNKSSGVSANAKNQLTGEAKFFRALMYFNMVNYFGGVPISSDVVELNNAFKPRASVTETYAQILADLKDAQNLLPTNYVGTAALKVRANKWAATALLAKVYLYNKDYVNAEVEATKVIGSGTYSMATVANTFINTSPETILQLSTLFGTSSFTTYRTTSSANNVAPPQYVLYNNFTKDFELNDGRKASWVDSTTFNAVKYYRINKYKVQTATAATLGNEYTVLFRLGEMYLIRAEARAQQTNVTGSQSDLNVIRTRAGLANTNATTPATLLSAIAKERKLELFGEFANRWFDLKRTGTADAVLGPLKSTYKTTAQLYPIPLAQIVLNNNLTQNPGYN
ncbi:RagB/SusD family nutrient uptake outer membrane protein [Pedobacter jejuensis]|uniref:RagB/SusD family nutrient uptake outer membrane protein n=1 Tax=Pedobacter jejuensis TaxID=1268550 RepID=A0A3N0C125_9SPHI|nr:RagB/SusD family nutrient uptake outer membrane protein [Pedobacter jejuensis]RNL55764.1 RagB/SusD family nutrient uptake outer membrane protein [Pedobacter jejuensis]